MASKLKNVKFVNAVRVPGGVHPSTDCVRHDIELDGAVVKVWPKGMAHKQQPIETPLINVIDFERLPEAKEEANSVDSTPAGSSRPRKASK
jgi:hypothetical protein